mgnify:CR=1 FL=1
MSGAYTGVELNITAKIETVCDVVDVFQDLSLGAIALRPTPLLLKVVGERIGVFEAVDITPTTRITVPVPSTADIVTCFNDANTISGAAQFVQCVKSANSGADNDYIEFTAVFASAVCG